MFSILLALLLLFSVNDDGGGPVNETCAFLPASDPCHFPPPPPSEQCFDENGHQTLCPPL